MSVDQRPKLHVIFGDSAAGSIRQALGQLGCVERVIGLPDDLSSGPIDCPDPRARQAAIEDLFGYDYEEAIDFAELFWAEATSDATLPVAWVCRNRASEYAGFLEFLRRIGDAPFLVIDATDVEISSYAPGGEPSRPWSLGILSFEQIIAAGLFERQAVLSPEKIAAYRSIWRRLQAENAPLRIVDATGLVSVPITYFDDAIVSWAATDWERGARLVGRSMGELYHAPFGPCPGDLVLWARVLALADEGRLEVSGDGTEMRGTLVRRRTEA